MHRSNILPLFVLAALSIPNWGLAQESPPLSAFAGYQKADKRFGGDALKYIVRMEGLDGRTQPESWELVVHDPASKFSLKNYIITPQKTEEQGPNEYLYPNNPPTGMFSWSQVQVDSSAAFRILDSEARRSGIGFNSVNYTLRSREFTSEPIWDVTAVDSEGYPVGRIYLSAATGEVFRTIWFAWEEDRAAAPTIADTALVPSREGMVQSDVPRAAPYDQSITQGPTLPTTPATTPPSTGPNPVLPVDPAMAPDPEADQLPPAVRPMLPASSASSAPVNTNAPPPVPDTDPPAMEGPPRALRPGGATGPAYGGSGPVPSPDPTSDPVEVEPLPPANN